ncbi:hypothetical protein F443_13874 [Phytophthora nicotianae P1569]|uniref:RanBP2-type domain-containing protein n=3 Tax=Phytophthora nicotianae TaxID=4792 RepID=V9ERV2_PHYNI|nr:hypothetical protein F443_13874 [Phytophthora nicotianae P1569]
MARTRKQEAAIEEWSCPLCTLLNAAAEDRCAACDNARPPVHQLRNSQSTEPSTASATASEVQFVYRPSAGVFFSSLPRNQSDPGATSAWRQEPRLKVNRRRGNRRQNVVIEAERKPQREQVDTGRIEQNAGSTATQRIGDQDSQAETTVKRPNDAVEPATMLEEEEERQEEAEEEDIAMEEPCFNLLGSGTSVFTTPVAENVVEDPCATDKTKSRDGSVDMVEDVEISSPPRYTGFIPASKVRIEESKIEDKLASAGLDLSDSENEDDNPKLLGRQDETDNAWEDKWVCQICTNLNAQTAMECSSCSCKRYRDPPRTPESTGASNLRWACHICTNLNPPDTADCLMCLSTRKMDAVGSNDRWKCSLCATFNAPGTTRCELCDRSRDDEPKKAAAKGPQCPVCTNINAPGRTRCELCDSALPTDEEIPEDQFVDLSSSPLERKPSYTIDDDLENPYADLSQYDAYDAPNEVAGADLDYVEDISDNEATMSLTNPRPLTVRSELKEFEHFVCMEDLRRDYGCRINYKKMFAGQRSRKSYADRLATRQAESRKRKRNAARKEAGEAPKSYRRGGKAGKSGKKRKATGSPRRASAGGTKYPRGKRARKTGASARRASSATTSSPGINHYDDSAADFGENLNTMAWEGSRWKIFLARVEWGDGSTGNIDLWCLTAHFDRIEATMTTLEEAKAFLKKESPDGTNLYDHLGDVLLKIIVERPENLHETFENISTLVKQQRYLAPQQPPTADGDAQLSSIKKQAQAHQENWCNVALELLKLKSEDEAPSEPATGVADLLDEANMFEWAGLGFSKGETFRLSLALQRLAHTNGTVNMRFWGKILGRGADYYIAEGELSTAYEPEDLDAEEGATGVNKLTYWAMKDNGMYQWVQLPPVRRDQILAARQLRRYVRGDLEAPVLGHPPFPGVEKNYLRAQIARISAGTVLCPAGYFEVNEEGDITPVEEPEIKATADLLDLGSWTHFTKEINARYGRMTPMPPLTNADGEEEPREGEEFAPPLRALSEDKPQSWRVDRQPGTLQPSVGEVAIVRSLVWPGAASIAVGKKFLNVYVGHGVKFLSEPFQLAPPQRLQSGSCVSLSEDAEGEGKPTLRCEIPVEQPDLLEDPSPPAEEEE